ncbi:MAG: sulfotransferase [Bacteroidetes bacterium]|nr:sulfotransferase [Bacteroidota bacterium]
MSLATPPILITGAHRSGSTWVGQVLAKAPRCGYLHEPFNPIYPQNRKAAFNKWFLHIGHHNELIYRTPVSNILKWKYDAWAKLGDTRSRFKRLMWLKYNWIYAKNRGRQVIMKDPIALFSTKYIVEEFGSKALILVRHPAAFAYSLKRKSWMFPFIDILSQTELVNDHFLSYKEQLTDFTKMEYPILEQAALLWNLMYTYVQNIAKEEIDGVFIKLHEEISTNPDSEFEAIFKDLQLEFNDDVRRFIKESSGMGNAKETKGAEENLKRNSRENAWYWRNKLSNEEITLVKELTKKVWPFYYKEESWHGGN